MQKNHLLVFAVFVTCTSGGILLADRIADHPVLKVSVKDKTNSDLLVYLGSILQNDSTDPVWTEIAITAKANVAKELRNRGKEAETFLLDTLASKSNKHSDQKDRMTAWTAAEMIDLNVTSVIREHLQQGGAIDEHFTVAAITHLAEEGVDSDIELLKKYQQKDNPMLQWAASKAISKISNNPSDREPSTDDSQPFKLPHFSLLTGIATILGFLAWLILRKNPK